MNNDINRRVAIVGTGAAILGCGTTLLAAEQGEGKPHGEVRFKLTGNEVQIKKEGFSKSKGYADYTCYLINRTPYSAVAVQIVSNGQESPLRPPIARTCTDDCQTCSNNAKYFPYLVAQQGDSDFQVKLKFDDGQGNTGYSDPITITCGSQRGYNGQVDCTQLVT